MLNEGKKNRRYVERYLPSCLYSESAVDRLAYASMMRLCKPMTGGLSSPDDSDRLSQRGLLQRWGHMP